MEVKCKVGDGKCLRPPGLDILEESRDSRCKGTVLGKKMDCRNQTQQSLEIIQKPRNSSKQSQSHENYTTEMSRGKRDMQMSFAAKAP